MALAVSKPRHPALVRLLHWSYATAVLAGIWSGLYIADPGRSLGFRTMDQAKATHRLAMYLLIGSYLARVYYGYATGDYRQVLLDRQAVREMPGFVKYELFLTGRKPKFPKYNPGQKALFTTWLLLLPLQIVTGLALHAARAKRAGLGRVRQWHYLFSLPLASLAAGHIYLALTDSLRKLKSIFTGRE